VGFDAEAAYNNYQSYGATTLSQTKSTAFSAGIRFGVNVPLGGTNQHSRTRTWIDISAPVLLHPSSHFFVGAGPFLFHELSDKDQYDFENTATQLGVSFFLGGWFGGSGGRAGRS
jgi:hypothetical protein